ncbi:MAG: glycosyltransferase family 1 protein [Halioglobus sp.]
MDSSDNTHSPVNLILETDSVIHPLTGIGRYTYELATRFHQMSAIDDLKLFNRGQWQNPDTIEDPGSTRPDPSDSAPLTTEKRQLKHLLTRNKLAVASYRRIIPAIHKRRLNVFSDTHIYHAPNFMLLPYNGRKVVTFHDLSVLKYPQYHTDDRVGKLAPEMEKAAINADHIITDSETVRQEVINYFGLAPNRVSAVHLASALNLEHSDEASRARWLQQQQLKDKTYFLFVSTLEPRKNVSALLRAYDQLPTNIKASHPLVLAGQLGWNSSELRDEISSLKARNNILLPGYLSNHQLAHLYAGATALIFPSIYEGFGLPIIEAQSFGTPVITSTVSCMPEVAGEGALLADPADTEAISMAMQSIIEDTKLASRLRQAGKTNADKYSWEDTAKKTLAIYRSLAR